jgi:uncharacterized protein YjiS (DUF1127 family)
MLKRTLRHWAARSERARQRRAFLELPDFILRDIGLTRDDLRRTGSARALGW